MSPVAFLTLRVAMFTSIYSFHATINQMYCSRNAMRSRYAMRVMPKLIRPIIIRHREATSSLCTLAHIERTIPSLTNPLEKIPLLEKTT